MTAFIVKFLAQTPNLLGAHRAYLFYELWRDSFVFMGECSMEGGQEFYYIPYAYMYLA